MIYKYCIETKTGDLLYKADPFANYAEMRPGTASKVHDISNLKWSDSAWMEAGPPGIWTRVLSLSMSAYRLLEAASWRGGREVL